MPATQPFRTLAEAVADGEAIDWRSLERSASGTQEQDALAALRHVSVVSGLFATLARTSGSSTQPLTRLDSGTDWGGLRILDHLGHGRYGDVYRAWDPALDRHVALKLIGGDDRAGAETKVVEEGRLMARVRHPNVVTIYGAQRIGDVAGLSMELVEGRTLEAELAERGPFPAEEIENVGRQLSEALAAVHGAGLVHRDVKASNALRDANGRVVLGDFGTGRELNADEAGGDGLVGTPAYLAPEIFARQAATPQSDVYSLGVLLFHLATGEYPHAARSLGGLREAHSRGRARSLGELRPDLPARLVGLIDRALDPDPAQRFQSGSELAGALTPRPHERRPRWPMVASALVAAAALALALWFGWPAGPAPMAVARDWVLVTAFEN